MGLTQPWGPGRQASTLPVGHGPLLPNGHPRAALPPLPGGELFSLRTASGPAWGELGARKGEGRQQGCS